MFIEKLVFRFLERKYYFVKKFVVWHQAVHIKYLKIHRLVCVIQNGGLQSVDRHTDRHTHGQTKE